MTTIKSLLKAAFCLTVGSSDRWISGAENSDTSTLLARKTGGSYRKAETYPKYFGSPFALQFLGGQRVFPDFLSMLSRLFMEESRLGSLKP